MNQEEMKQRTKLFALGVIQLVESLPKERTAAVLGGQLLRSGTSVGSNYRSACRARSIADFIEIAPENPVLWTGMKGASAEGGKKTNQMLKQVQHDMTVRFWSFCHPELVSGSLFWV